MIESRSVSNEANETPQKLSGLLHIVFSCFLLGWSFMRNVYDAPDFLAMVQCVLGGLKANISRQYAAIFKAIKIYFFSLKCSIFSYFRSKHRLFTKEYPQTMFKSKKKKKKKEEKCIPL